MPTITIRQATIADTAAITALEAACFPPAEAAPYESFAARLEAFPDRFWLLFADGELVSMVNGSLSDEPDLRDEMFHDTTLHDPNGRWQMIFGVATHPDHRCLGYAGMLLETAIRECREEAPQGREGLVLTCKEHKLRYYAKFGFVNEGISSSEHGGAAWYQMRIRFDRETRMKDWLQRHIGDEIREILISKNDLWRINEQSCDCQSVLIRTAHERIRVTYQANSSCESEALVFTMASEQDEADFAYRVELDGEPAYLEKIAFTEEGSIEGLKFRMENGFLFLFASTHNLIVTRSIFDLIDDTDSDFPAKEATLKLVKRTTRTL